MAVLLATNFPADALERWLAQWREAMPGESFVTDRSACDPEAIDIAVVANPPAGALQGLPNLQLIQSMWAGVDKLLGDPTIPTGVPLARMVDPAMNQAMAETALWAVLSLHRGFFAYAARQRAGEWRTHGQRRADEVHVAVLGLGQMGRTVALRLAANGYSVSGWATRAAVVPGVTTHSGDIELRELLVAADIAVNLLPLTPQTECLFNAQSFARMRPNACLVNLARGAHVVDADLLAALDSGHLRHAVLDVFHAEPLPADHAFWSHPQVTLLPHVAAQTDLRSATALAAANLRAWREGRPLAHLVDRARGY